ncbi:MAG: D-glycero-D-manno-heptose 1-phosphate guanosyltransferase [Methanosarcinales archaeon]|nr:MAG: D-glycero-D-manno-heptose 1-phosphate guanosyltransferase [Methanosarcinales archaeon]
MEAIILAGGAGTRLKSLIKDVPKPMADINGRPFLCYLLDYLSSQGITKILLSVGYRHEVIRDYFGLQYRDMDISYIVEDEPLGTGGALKKALSCTEGRDVIVLNGDTFFNLDLKKMIDFHHAEDSMLTIAVKPMHDFNRYGTVIIKDKRAVGFEEKSFKHFGYINGGIYVVKKAIAEFFDHDKNTFSFETVFLYKKINDIHPCVFISDDYFIDIGIPDDYRKAQRELDHVFKGAQR